MSDETRVFEKIGQIAAKADAAHSRLDRLEIGVRDDLKEITNELKKLNEHMNRGKGWAAAAMLFAGLAGAGIVKLISLAFH